MGFKSVHLFTTYGGSKQLAVGQSMRNLNTLTNDRNVRLGSLRGRVEECEQGRNRHERRIRLLGKNGNGKVQKYFDLFR